MFNITDIAKVANFLRRFFMFSHQNLHFLINFLTIAWYIWDPRVKRKYLEVAHRGRFELPTP